MGKGDAALTLAASHEHLLSTEGSLQEWKTPNHFVPNTSPFQGYFLRKNVLSSCCPIVAEEEAGCSFLSSDSLRYGELLIWGKEELSRSTSLGEACREIKQMHSGSFGLGFVNFWLLFCFCCVFCSLGLFVCFLMKANLNEDRNSSPYFPLEQRSFPVSEPTRLHAMPVTSPGCVRALDRGGENDRKKVTGFPAVFTWFRWSPPWFKISGAPTQKYMMGLWTPFSSACLHLPFLLLQPQEETALKTAAFPELFVLLKPFVARPPWWWKEQCVIWGAVLKEAFLSFPSQGGPGWTCLSPFLWIIGNLFACSQGLHLLSWKCSRLLEAVRHWWQSTGAIFGFWW